MKLLMIIPMLLLIFDNCGHKNVSNHERIILNDENGNLRKELWYSKESGLLDSVCIIYFPDGKVDEVFYYKDGDLEGEAIYYYPNGMIRRRVFYVKNKEVNYSLRYNSNGSIKQYAFVDYDGNTRFTVDYGGSNNRLDGKFFYLLYNKKDFNYVVHSACPPDSKVIFKVFQNDKVIREFDSEFYNSKCRYCIELLLPLENKIKTKVIGSLIDIKNNQLIKLDSIIVN